MENTETQESAMKKMDAEKRLTHKEKEAKFAPVVMLLLKSNQAHGLMTKAKEDVKAAAKAAYEIAEKAVKAAQADYTPQDVKMLLEQFGQYIYANAMSAVGNGVVRWNSRRTASLVKGMYGVIDDRTLTRDDKDTAKKYPALKIRYLNLHLAFIAGCEAVGYTPKFKIILNNGKVEFVDFSDRSRSGKLIGESYGMQEGTVKEVLKRLNDAVSKLNVQIEASTDMEAREKLNKQAHALNTLAGDLKRRLNSAQLGYWLKERKPQEPMPERTVDTATLPEGVTVNDQREGVATMGQALEPMGEPAAEVEGAQVAEPVNAGGGEPAAEPVVANPPPPDTRGDKRERRFRSERPGGKKRR